MQMMNPTKHKLTKAPKKGKTRIKMEGPTCKKTNEPPKRGKPQGNIKFWNTLLLKKVIK